MDRKGARLRRARRWRERAFAAELLGRAGNARAVPALLETVLDTRTEDADVRDIAMRALGRIADPRAVGPLVASLTTAEPWLAPRIADILARHGDHAVDPLLELLDRPGPPVARAWAANVLGEVRAPRAYPALARGLADADDEVRAKSATALGRLGDPRAVALLLDHLVSDPAPFVRARIAGALGRFDAPAVIDRLIRALGDPAWWVRMRSVEALEQIGARAEGPLLTALGDPDAEIRARAATALERLGVPGRLVGMLERGERAAEATEALARLIRAGTRELLAELLARPSGPVRSTLVTLVRRSGRPDLAALLGPVARTDDDPTLRAAALDTLGELGGPDAAPAAVAGAADPDAAVRAAAIGVLERRGGPEVVDLLRERTSDSDPGVRAAAARALGRRHDTGAGPALLGLLADPAPAVREAAAIGAARVEAAGAVGALIELLRGPDVDVHSAAAEGLGLLGAAESVPALVHAFSKAHPGLREVILEAVNRIDPVAVPGLVSRLVESDDTLGILEAVRTIDRIGSPAAPAVLARLRQNPAPTVRAAVMMALGEPTAEDPVASARFMETAVAAGMADPEPAVRAAALDTAARLALRSLGADVLARLRHDGSPRVRERAALTAGVLRPEGGAAALVAACQRSEALEVRAAAALATGAFGSDSIVACTVAMEDQSAVRTCLRERVSGDAAYRRLIDTLPPAARLELVALGAATDEAARTALGGGVAGLIESQERLRLVVGLRAFEGVESRAALLELVRSDPAPDVRAAALSAAAAVLDDEDRLALGRGGLLDASPLVRRAAVEALGTVDPARSLPLLLQTLRADDDPIVLASVAGLAESAFTIFGELVLNLALDAEEALLVAHVARHIHHPGLSRLLPALARSGWPAVREAIAELWRHRPGVVDPVWLKALARDPVAAVRRQAAGAAASAGAWVLLGGMADDPDAQVRRAVALAMGNGAGRNGPTDLMQPADALVDDTLARLADDREMLVRAAAYVGRLLLGAPVPLPPGLDPVAAAGALRSAARLPELRETARTAPREDHRLAAALALALLEDDVARQVSRTDPVPAIRHRVSGALELATAAREGR